MARMVRMGLPVRFRSIVLGSGGACSRSSWWDPQRLGHGTERRAIPVDPRQIVSAALSGIEHYEFPDSVREDYLSAYDGDRFVESMRYVRADPTELPILAELLPQIETLVEIIGRLWDWGTEQPQVSP